VFRSARAPASRVPPRNPLLEGGFGRGAEPPSEYLGPFGPGRPGAEEQAARHRLALPEVAEPRHAASVEAPLTVAVVDATPRVRQELVRQLERVPGDTETLVRTIRAVAARAGSRERRSST